MTKLLAHAGVAALAAAALFSSAPAHAQNNVVQQPTAQPSPAPAQPASQPEPVVERPAQPINRPNRFLLMTGLVLFGAPYVASVGLGAASHHDGDSNLYVPLAGPWIDLASRPQCPSGTDCSDENADRALLIGDGVLQTIGALEVLGAFVFPETVGVASIGSKDSNTAVSFTPSKIGRDGYGLSAVGWF